MVWDGREENKEERENFSNSLFFLIKTEALFVFISLFFFVALGSFQAEY